MNVSTIKRHLAKTICAMYFVILASALAACSGNESDRMSDTESALKVPTATDTNRATATPTATLTATPHPVPYANVISTMLYVRSGPGTAYDRIGIVSESERLEVLGQAFDCAWLQVLTSANLEGWVSSEFVDLVWPCGDLAAAAIPVTPTSKPTTTRTHPDSPTHLPQPPSPTLASADTPTPTRSPQTPSPTVTLASADTPTPTPRPGTPTPPPMATLASADTPTPTPIASPTLAISDLPTPTIPVESTEAPAEPVMSEPDTLHIQPLRPVPIATLRVP